MRNAFTLIELLLVIGIIAILAVIAIVAINPTKQLREACLKTPFEGDCPRILRETSSSAPPQQCVIRTGGGCCERAHEEIDRFGSTMVVCDSLVPSL